MLAAAEAARRHAYAPYSNYSVGAAVASADGRIWTGSNVENVSFGLALCAERAAIAKMVNDGVTGLASVAVVTQDGGTPCGMCLQTMLEFAPAPDRVVIVVKGLRDGSVATYRLADLLPHGFRTKL